MLRFRSTSHRWREFVDEEGEAIWQALAGTKGWTAEHTASAGTGSGRALPDGRAQAPSDALERAIAAQSTLDRPFEGVTTWREFIDRRWRAEQAWTRGRETLQEIDIGMHTAFRFKLDTQSSSVLFSSPAHQINVVNLAAETAAHQVIPAPQYSHVEYTEGYMCFAASEQSIAIFHRPAPGAPFARLHLVTLAHPVRAYKARAPVMVVAGPRGDFTVLDLASGRPVQRGRVDMTPPEAQSVTYVEIDAERLYIALDTRIDIVSREDGRVIDALGPISNFHFQACHVDVRGRHLVAIASRRREHGGAVIVHDLQTQATSFLRINQAPRELAVEVRYSHAPFADPAERPCRLHDLRTSAQVRRSH